MIICALIIASMHFQTLWEADFKSDTGRWVADERNPVSISYFSAKSLQIESGHSSGDDHSKVKNEDTIGYVHIEGSPEDVGRSSAWLYVEGISTLSTTAYISLRLKGNGNLVRFRILFKSFGKTPYYYLQKTVRIPDDWKELKISFKTAHPIWSSNYPHALTPGLSPDFYLFVENGEPGCFSVDIDKIVVKSK